MDLTREQVAITIAVLALAILGSHLVACILVWRRVRSWIALLVIVAVSILTQLVWFFTGAAIQLTMLWSSDARGIQYDTYFATFGLLITPCDRVPGLEDVLGPGFCNQHEPYIWVFGMAVFVLLGLAVAPVALIRHR